MRPAGPVSAIEVPSLSELLTGTDIDRQEAVKWASEDMQTIFMWSSKSTNSNIKHNHAHSS